MSNLKEYIVTVKTVEDLQSFYDDMETEGGDLYIPNRQVECANRRPISRNTHYMLTHEEAMQLINDPRVEGVELAAMIAASIRPLYEQTGNFSRSTSQSASHINWGLLRCLEEVNRSNWGSNGTATQNATIDFDLTGRNVDVIIIDGHIDPNHPEYAVNNDGTGGSRVNQLNWHSYTSQADSLDNDGAGLLSSTYVYTPYDNGSTQLTEDNNHGAHCAGTAAGNTQGWARNANIYNISPYGSNPNGTVAALIMWDYIRAFHRNKPINPATGRKNPTVCNGSYGSALDFPYNYGSFTTGGITYINNRGTEYGTPSSTTTLSDANITAGGIRVDGGIATVPIYSTSIAADIQDAIADGIHVVGAAGNEYSKVDVPGGLDYNNFCYAEFDSITYLWYIHRGTTPSAAPGAICVGNIDTFYQEYKRGSSNCGPRVDVYAPGSSINSSVNSTTSFGGVSDPRNASYNVVKISGTSMASPQVCGVVACLLEAYPYLSPAQARTMIIDLAKVNQITDTGGTQSDITSLQGAPNRYLYIRRERQSVNSVYPKVNNLLRPTTGAVYPRFRKR
jgi:subtilisin family serine protease